MGPMELLCRIHTDLVWPCDKAYISSNSPFLVPGWLSSSISWQNIDAEVFEWLSATRFIYGIFPDMCHLRLEYLLQTLLIMFYDVSKRNMLKTITTFDPHMSTISNSARLIKCMIYSKDAELQIHLSQAIHWKLSLSPFLCFLPLVEIC